MTNARNSSYRKQTIDEAADEEHDSQPEQTLPIITFSYHSVGENLSSMHVLKAAISCLITRAPVRHQTTKKNRKYTQDN